MKEEKPTGRPTKWTPELNEKLIEYFGTEDRWENRLSVEITKKTGEVVQRFDPMPRPIPWFSRFEKNNGLSIGILSKWAEQEEKLIQEKQPPSKPGFLQAYKAAKDFQKEFLVQNGVAGISNAAMTIFTLKNVSDMRDKVETDVTSNGQTINLVHYGSNDPLQLAAREASASGIAKPGAVQGPGMAPKGQENDTRDQRIAALGGICEGDVLVRGATIKPSEEDRLGGTRNASEVLSPRGVGEEE